MVSIAQAHHRFGVMETPLLQSDRAMVKVTMLDAGWRDRVMSKRGEVGRKSVILDGSEEFGNNKPTGHRRACRTSVGFSVISLGLVGGITPLPHQLLVLS